MRPSRLCRVTDPNLDVNQQNRMRNKQRKNTVTKAAGFSTVSHAVCQTTDGALAVKTVIVTSMHSVASVTTSSYLVHKKNYLKIHKTCLLLLPMSWWIWIIMCLISAFCQFRFYGKHEGSGEAHVGVHSHYAWLPATVLEHHCSPLPCQPALTLHSIIWAWLQVFVLCLPSPSSL